MEYLETAGCDECKGRERVPEGKLSRGERLRWALLCELPAGPDKTKKCEACDGTGTRQVTHGVAMPSEIWPL